MLQEANIICHPVAALGYGRKHIQNTAIDLSGVGLTANIETAVKAEVCADHAIHFIDLCCVSAKQFQEARFRAGSTTAPEEFHCSDHKIQFFQIGPKILHPKCGPLTHRHQLSRLIVSIPQSRHGFVLIRKGRQVGNYLQQLRAKIL